MRYLTLLLLTCVTGVLLVATAARAITVNEPGPAPTMFRAVAGNGTVTLTWVPPAAAASVELLQNGTVIARNVTVRAWSPQGVRNGTTYRYVVRGVDAKGRRSKPTPPLTVTPQPPPLPPTAVSVRNQDRQVTVTWTPPRAVATAVRVTVDGRAAGTVPVSGGSLVVPDLDNDRSYLVTVDAVNANGTASRSVSLTATPTAQYQKSPFALTPTAGDAEVGLTWAATPGAERYVLYRDRTPVRTLPADATATSDAGLRNTTTYRYQIQVVVGGQNSALSPAKVAIPLAVPAVPGPVTARARDRAALLSWPAPADPVAAYELRRDGVRVADIPGAEETFTDHGLINGRTYTYTLVPQNANTVVGPESPAVSVVPAPPPPAPAPPSAVAGDHEVTLAWAAVDGIDRWVLLRDGQRLAAVTATSFVDTSTDNGRVYRYTLVAVSADEQESPPSRFVQAVPKLVPPRPPAGLQAHAGDSEVSLTWQVPVPAPPLYRVYRDDAVVLETGGGSARDAALDNGTTYRYAVTAVDARGIESERSDPVTATPRTVGPGVPSLRVESGHEQAVLSFGIGADRTATGWRVLRDGAEVATTTGTEFTERSLTDGRSYRYQVQAVYADGQRSSLSPVVVAAPRAPWRGIAVGADFACGLHADTGVRCWGGNDRQQLGDGSTTPAASGPVTVAVPAGVTRIAAGPRHACAITADQRLWCWGAAPGNPGGGRLPAPVAGLTGVTAVAAGGSGTCAVAQGAVWCGAERIALPAVARDVTVGGRHACALLDDATVACWGADEHGQSSGSPGASTGPVRVAGLTGVSAVAAGTDHTCVLAGPAVSCFGAGDAGQLGRGTTPAAGRPAPVDVPDAAAVSAGDRYTCVTLRSGQARCFGVAGGGQLGDGRAVDTAAPAAVLNLDTATAVAAGSGATTCALTRDGSLWCFGDNGSGQTGTGERGSLSQPSAPIPGLDGAAQLGVGTDASCMIRDAAVWCWGVNRFGAAAAPAGVPVPSPSRVALPDGRAARSVAVGPRTVCAVTTTAELYCWGENDAGQAGQPAEPVVGVSRVDLATVGNVYVGGKATCARKLSGSLWCFGRADLLGAGHAEQEPHPQPEPVIDANGAELTGVALAAAGDRHMCAVDRYSAASPGSGGLWCFGENDEGQLGGVRPGTVARRVSGVGAVVAVAGGRAHTCVVSVTPASSLWCFGANNAGQLGLGDTRARSAPTRVPGLLAGRPALGGDVTCVRSSNPAGWCFGANAAGQTGNGVMRATEVNPQLSYHTGGLLAPTAYTTNGSTTCASLPTAAVLCWGIRALTSFGEGARFGYPTRPVLD